MKLTPNRFADDAPADVLWHHYSGQLAPQNVFASLDLSDGEWTIDYSGEVGPGLPAAVWHGVVRRFPLAVIPTADGANRLLDRAAGAAQRVLDAHESGDDEAIAAAETELAEQLADIPAADTVAVWSLDALGDLGDLGDDITADMSDDDIETYATDVLWQLAADAGVGVAVCDGLVEFLTEERDSKRAAEAFA
jgi:hypothetical protein